MTGTRFYHARCPCGLNALYMVPGDARKALERHQCPRRTPKSAEPAPAPQPAATESVEATQIPCTHCGRPMRPIGVTAIAMPDAVQYGGYGLCGSCRQHQRDHGTLDDWTPGTPRGRVGTVAGTRTAPVAFIPLASLQWQDSALCAQTDPEPFFPAKGEPNLNAKAVCRSCEVTAECPEYALTNDIVDGIWGGLSYRQRLKLKRRGAA